MKALLFKQMGEIDSQHAPFTRGEHTALSEAGLSLSLSLQPEAALKRRRPALGPCRDGRLEIGRLHHDVLPLRRQPGAQLREVLAEAFDPVVARRLGLAEPRHIICDSVLVRRQAHARKCAQMEKRDAYSPCRRLTPPRRPMRC